MGQYNFKAPGASAADAITQFFIQRDMENRQQMLDALMKEREAEERRVRDREFEFRQGQESRIAAEQRRQAERQATIGAQADEDRRAARSRAQNQIGVRQLMTDRLTMGPLDRDTAQQMSVMGWSEGVGVPGIIQRAAEPPSRHVVRTPDAQGNPMDKAFTDDELAAGVRVYQPPVQGPRPEFEWVIRGGEPTQIRRGTARPGDKPYDEVSARGGGGSDYFRFLTRWASGQGLKVNDLTTEQELTARRQYSEAGRDDDDLFGGLDTPTGAAPAGAAGARAGGAGRAATAADVQAVAQRAGISEAEARRRLEAAGVVIR